MRSVARLLGVLLLAACTAGTGDHNSGQARDFNLISFHWEAEGRSKDVRFCELLGTGQKIPLDADVVLNLADLHGARLSEKEGTVRLLLTPEGRDKLERETEANIGRRLAVVIDNEVVALPTVMNVITSEEIPLMPMAGYATAQDLLTRIQDALGGADS